MVLIDLGDERWAADELPPRRRGHGHPSRLVLLLAMLVALLPFVGSARPAPLITAPLWTANEPGVVMGDRVYTFNNLGRVTARSVRDGAVEWQLTGDSSHSYLVELNGGLLGFATSIERSGSYERIFMRTTTQVVDPDDGRVLATVSGEPLGRVSDGVTLFGTLVEDFEQSCDLEWSKCLDLSGVDARTGAVVWRLPYRRDREPIWSTVESGIDSFGLIDAGGQFIAHDPAAGRPLRAVAIPFWPDDVKDATPAHLMQLGMFSLQNGRLISAREKLAALDWSVIVSSLDLDTGRSWSTTFAAAESGFRYPSTCGRWLCVADQWRAIVLDPDTGVELSRVDGFAMEVGRPDLLGLWQFETGAPGSGWVRLFDPVAGAKRATVPGAVQPVGGRPDLLVVSASASAPSEVSRSDVYRVDRDGEPRVVMTIEPTDYCQAWREYLVCRTGDPSPVGSVSLVRLHVFQLSAAAMASAY